MNTTPRDNQTIIAATDGQHVYCSTGEVLPIAIQPGPVSAASLAEACVRRHITQLWCHPAPVLTFAGAHGWEFRQETDNEPVPWAHGFKKGTDLDIAIARPGLDRNSPWKDAPDARTLLAGLLRYRELVGVTFHHSPSASSRALLTGLHLGHKHNIPMREVPQPPPALDISTEEPLQWMLSPEEVRQLGTYGYAHCYDKNAAYLGAAYGLDLGAGKPEHRTGQLHGKDLELPGYFRIETPATESGIPSFAAARTAATGDGTRWVTTPTLAYLVERYAVPPIHEAYVWREHHQPLQPWYQRLRDARAQLQEERDQAHTRMMLAAVKGSYTSLLTGYMASTTWDRSGDVLYRPDIRHHIIAKARCTLIRTSRRLEQNGATVLGINGVDTVYVLSNDPDPAHAAEGMTMHLGAALPNYKVKHSQAITPALRATLEQDGLALHTRFASLDDDKEGPANVRA